MHIHDFLTSPLCLLVIWLQWSFPSSIRDVRQQETWQWLIVMLLLVARSAMAFWNLLRCLSRENITCGVHVMSFFP
jgi:hypothetical protein